jgi:hypothetical protein
MKDYRRRTKSVRTSRACNALLVRCSFLVACGLLTLLRCNSSAAIKHARNLPRHMLQVHGHCKGHFLRVSRIPLTPHCQSLSPGNVTGLWGRRRFTGQWGNNAKCWDTSGSDGSCGVYGAVVVHLGIITSILSQSDEGIALRHTVFVVVRD